MRHRIWHALKYVSSKEPSLGKGDILSSLRERLSLRLVLPARLFGEISAKGSVVQTCGVEPIFILMLAKMVTFISRVVFHSACLLRVPMYTTKRKKIVQYKEACPGSARLPWLFSSSLTST